MNVYSHQSSPNQTPHLSTKIQQRPWHDLEVDPAQTVEQSKVAIADFSHVDLFSHAPVRSPIQAKVNMGKPNAPCEPEAEQVAEQSRSMTPPSTPNLQRQDLSIQRQASPEENLQAQFIQQRGDKIASDNTSPDLASGINSTRGSGQPLEPGLQRSTGQAMDADFSGMRVHPDAQSNQVNESIQATALTTEQDVFLGQGAYESENGGGQELLTHELPHGEQQMNQKVQRSHERNNQSIGEKHLDGIQKNAVKDTVHPLQNSLIQRVFLSYEEAPKGREFSVLSNYIRLIYFRRPAIESIIGQEGWNKSEPIIKKKLKEASAQNLETKEKQLKINEALCAIKVFIEYVNKKAESSQEARSTRAIIPLTLNEAEELRNTFKVEIKNAIDIVKALQQDPKTIKIVFKTEENEVDQVQKDLTAVEAQLWEWRWQKKDKLRLDQDGTMAAGNTTAQANIKTGGLTLTRKWVTDKSSKQRQQTLIHEASHASAVKTKDIAYTWGWAYAALTGKEKRKNADSYAEATSRNQQEPLPLKELTYHQDKVEQSKENTSPQFELKDPNSKKQFINTAKEGLGKVDMLLSKARTLSGNIAILIRKDGNKPLAKEYWEFAYALGAPFTQEPWEETKLTSAYDIQNIDLETIMMFRDSLANIHNKITDVKTIELIPNNSITYVSNKKLICDPKASTEISSDNLAWQLIMNEYNREIVGKLWKQNVIQNLVKVVSFSTDYQGFGATPKKEDTNTLSKQPGDKEIEAVKALQGMNIKLQELENLLPKYKGFEKEGTEHELAAKLFKVLKVYISELEKQFETTSINVLTENRTIIEYEKWYKVLANNLENRINDIPKKDQRRKIYRAIGKIGYQIREIWLARINDK
jgi:hypothetical protein